MIYFALILDRIYTRKELLQAASSLGLSVEKGIRKADLAELVHKTVKEREVSRRKEALGIVDEPKVPEGEIV